MWFFGGVLELWSLFVGLLLLPLRVSVLVESRCDTTYFSKLDALDRTKTWLWKFPADMCQQPPHIQLTFGHLAYSTIATHLNFWMEILIQIRHLLYRGREFLATLWCWKGFTPFYSYYTFAIWLCINRPGDTNSSVCTCLFTRLFWGTHQSLSVCTVS